MAHFMSSKFVSECYTERGGPTAEKRKQRGALIMKSWLRFYAIIHFVVPSVQFFLE